MRVFPVSVDPKGKTLIAGFSDGLIRLILFSENPESDPTRKAKQPALLALAQAIKPHSKPISSMAYDEQGELFATAVGWHPKPPIFPLFTSLEASDQNPGTGTVSAFC
ncbi:unnamed protein product [Protopolystoma xenopodis]|uniref:Anaphase-promoting complex subunit 4 WD40 domain-containing protein n=1 Tax=Protopolystoma xenopodis TaxID=117903 RepID=A0A448XBB8_9PLAT|nr:unnamed protein product [Protopolystoma xenopodis]